MTSKAVTVAQYLKELPADRREVVEAIRNTIKKNLDKGFQETVQYGGIGYSVPHKLYPAGYHCDPKQPLPFVGIGNQKNHIGIYLFCIYIDEGVQREFVEGWKKSGKKLDMGKGCVRVKKLDDVALDVLGKTIKKVKLKDFVAMYEKAIPASKRKK
jgi:uncharacterized protein YdhG (YjbR/CyaY superfamily)